jgi:hypothetical protein
MLKTNNLIKRIYNSNSPVPLHIFAPVENIEVFSSQMTSLKKYKFYAFEWNVEQHDNTLFYSQDTSELDIFGILEPIEKKNLQQNPEHFWVFDYSMEGNPEALWFKSITESAYRHDIPFNKIFFISSNLLEKEAYKQWCVKNNVSDCFNVVSLEYWSTVFMHGDFRTNYSIDRAVSYIKENKNKYFLSLNRRCRDFRIWTTMLLYQSKIFDRGLVSADKVNPDQIKTSKFFWNKHFGQELDETKFNNYLNSLPWVLDRSDFEVNWAWTNPALLFSQTLFSTVSETLHDDLNNTTLFYSEKSFKPMLHNHPVLIFGQPGINTGLKDIGYKTYDKHFDLNFDLVKNPVDRLIRQIEQLESICDMLDKLSIDSKVEWVMQDRETLIYNKNQLFEQSFNKQQLTQFIKMLEDTK